MMTTLKMYEVQFTSRHPKTNSYRPSARKFVFTVTPERAIALATAKHDDPVVHQVILRSGDHGVILDPEACAAVDPPVVAGVSPE